MTIDPYRTRDFVSDFDAISDEYAQRSREISAKTRLQTDVAYGERDREKIDLLFPSENTTDAPLHIFVHGGYWRHGDKANYRFVAEPALAAGAVVAIVEYDLMPRERLPLLVSQVRRAVSWLQSNAGKFGADSNRVTVSGHSAGAHLISYLGAKGPKDSATPELPNINGLLLLSGIYDLSDIPNSFLKNEAQMTVQEAADWSPLTAEHRPVLDRVIAFGSDETPPFHEQANRLDAKLRVAGYSTEVLPMHGLNHMSALLDLGSVNGKLGQRLAAMVSAKNSPAA